MSFEILDIEVKNHPEQQKVRCPECKKQGKQHFNDTCLSVNLTPGAYNCHKCGWNGYAYKVEKMEDKIYQKPDKKNFTKLSDSNLQYCSKRGITQEVVNRNKLIDSNINNWIIFPYFYDGEFVNFKARNSQSKDFRQQTEGKQIIYKYDDVKEVKEIIICEGEFDCLAFEVAGFLNTTSVSQGAPNEKDKNIDKKLECITNCFHVFEQSEIIYLAVDNDVNGNRLKTELIRRFGFEKCKTVDFKDCKDANEYLLKYGSEELIKAIKEAKIIKMSGIFTTEDVFENMLFTFRNGKNRGTTTHINSLDAHWTWRTKEVNLFSGYGNDGKSSAYNQLAILKAYYDDWKFAIFTPENMPIEDYFDDLIHCYMGKSTDKTFHNVMNEMEYIKAAEFIKTHFFLICPEDDLRLATIFERIEYLVRKYGINACFLDPYNQIEHLIERGEREDLYISRFMTKLSKLAVINNISVSLSAHQTTPIMLRGDLDYPRPDMYKIKGGGTFADKADNVILIWRPYRKSAPDSRNVKFCVERVRKQRLVGIPGETEIYYSRAKNQYFECVENCNDSTYFNIKFNQPEQKRLISIDQNDNFWDINKNIESNKPPF